MSITPSTFIAILSACWEEESASQQSPVSQGWVTEQYFSPEISGERGSAFSLLPFGPTSPLPNPNIQWAPPYAGVLTLGVPRKPHNHLACGSTGH